MEPKEERQENDRKAERLEKRRERRRQRRLLEETAEERETCLGKRREENFSVKFTADHIALLKGWLCCVQCPTISKSVALNSFYVLRMFCYSCLF